MGQPEIVGYRGKVNKQVLLDFSLFVNCSLYSVSLTTFFYLSFFRQVRGKVKVSFWVVCFSISRLKSVSQKVYFGVTKVWCPSKTKGNHNICLDLELIQTTFFLGVAWKVSWEVSLIPRIGFTIINENCERKLKAVLLTCNFREVSWNNWRLPDV